MTAPSTTHLRHPDGENADAAKLDGAWRGVLQTLASTLTESFTAAAEGAQDTPGETASAVRAYASLVIEQINGSGLASPEEAEEYQARRGVRRTGATTRSVSFFPDRKEFCILMLRVWLRPLAIVAVVEALE